MWSTVVRDDYTRQMPTSPDVSAGRVIGVQLNHGIVVYLNSAEYNHLLISGYVTVATFILLAAVVVARAFRRA
jgi:hypothetical protein